MLSKIARFIESHRLLSPSGGICLVGVSGGADSVCLLLVLKQLGYQVDAVHCNFRLRAAESDRDELFVKELCERHGISLHITHFDTKSYASVHQVGIETAARHLRYHYFEQLLHDLGAQAICVAHHQEDSAETVLMNLVRGTGIHGLQGIQPKRGHVTRPLLCVSRSEIEEWLARQGQDYVTDSTNLKADNIRNLIRLEILPRLRQQVPQATANILLTARRLTEAARVCDGALSAALSRLVCSDSVSIAALLSEPSPESLLYAWLRPAGFSPSTVEQIFAALPALSPGREWRSSTHWLVVHQQRLLLSEIQPERPTLKIPETGVYQYGKTHKLSISVCDERLIIRDALTCCADAEAVRFPLTVRPVRQGDRFCPLGMKGTRLVNDFLTDLHLPLPEKRRTLVVTDATDRIVWVVGHRPDHRFRITPLTSKTLIIKLSEVV